MGEEIGAHTHTQFVNVRYERLESILEACGCQDRTSAMRLTQPRQNQRAITERVQRQTRATASRQPGCAARPLSWSLWQPKIQVRERTYPD